MPAHKLDRTCSKCQARAAIAEAIKRWHRVKNWRGPSEWLCEGCYKPPEYNPPKVRRQSMGGLRMALMLAAVASAGPPRDR